ncbi:MAG: hypothetical protein M9962_02110 [Oligoflexia bacterium]|nr:hypothetical protein [Oligoflexia bacterium]
MDQLLLYFTIFSLSVPLLFFIFSPILSGINNERKNLFYSISYIPALLICLISAISLSESISLAPIFTLSLEKTGYFDFSLFLYWKSLFFISILAFFFLIRAYFIFIEENKANSDLYFSGASFFCFSLALLNENYFTEVFFTEIGAFLLYLDQTRKSSEIEALEKVYYFRRYIFIFLTCVSILILSFIPAFDIQSLILLAFLLYFLSFVFSKTKIKTFCQASELLIISVVPLYILDSFMSNGIRAGLELWAPIAILFGIISFYLILSVISHANFEIIISRLIPSVLGLYMYLNFSSGGNSRDLWALHLIAILISIGLLLLLRAMPIRSENKVFEILKYTMWFISLGLIVQFVPGPIMSLDSSIFNIFGVNPILVVLISTLITSELFIIQRSKNSTLGRVKKISDFRPFLFFLLFYTIFISIIFLKYKNLITLDMLKVDLQLYFTSWRIAEVSVAIVVGVLIYYWFSKAAFLAKFIQKIEKSNKESSPMIDARAWSLLLMAVSLPKKTQISIENFQVKLRNRIQKLIEFIDAELLLEFFYKIFNSYLVSTSGLIRLIHSGNGKVYYLVFFIIVSLFMFFLWRES